MQNQNEMRTIDTVSGRSGCRLVVTGPGSASLRSARLGSGPVSARLGTRLSSGLSSTALGRACLITADLGAAGLAAACGAARPACAARRVATVIHREAQVFIAGDVDTVAMPVARTRGR